MGISAASPGRTGFRLWPLGAPLIMSIYAQLLDDAPLAVRDGELVARLLAGSLEFGAAAALAFDRTIESAQMTVVERGDAGDVAQFAFR